MKSHHNEKKLVVIFSIRFVPQLENDLMIVQKWEIGTSGDGCSNHSNSTLKRGSVEASLQHRDDTVHIERAYGLHHAKMTRHGFQHKGFNIGLLSLMDM